MKLDPKADGTLAVEFKAVDRRRLNDAYMLLGLIKEHEPDPKIREAAKAAHSGLFRVCLHYAPAARPEPVPAA